jgi:membrane fusion protein, adhesin transport system
MSIHFSRSLRRLEADSSRRSFILLAVVIILVGLWTTWFVTARVAVYATTGAARLEVDQENHPVDAPVAGRVVVGHLSAGQKVRAGDVLLELDANPERLARNEAMAKLAPASHQLDSLKDELKAEERALEVERRGAEAANAEAIAKAQESAVAAEFAVEEGKRLADLQSRGLVSDLDALRGQKLAEARQSEARAGEFATRRLARDLDAKEQDRFARVARLKNEVAAIEGGRSQAVAASDTLDYQIEQRQVRAPIAGTLAEISALKVGGMVQPGDRICTIVPDGMLKVVALFAPSAALGRVHEGQSALVRLEGFPWTQYGSAHASVSHVSGEVRDGQIRVELALSRDADSAIPFQHGLPAEVDVEIERVSPMTMVLRSVGGRLRVSAATPSSLNIR